MLKTLLFSALSFSADKEAKQIHECPPVRTQILAPTHPDSSLYSVTHEYIVPTNCTEREPIVMTGYYRLHGQNIPGVPANIINDFRRVYNSQSLEMRRNFIMQYALYIDFSRIYNHRVRSQITRRIDGQIRDYVLWNNDLLHINNRIRALRANPNLTPAEQADISRFMNDAAAAQARINEIRTRLDAYLWPAWAYAMGIHQSMMPAGTSR